MATSVFTGWRTVTPGACSICGYDDDWQCDGRGNGGSAGVNSEAHFRATTKKVDLGTGAQRRIEDWFLTRYACYLIAMNGDSAKPESGAPVRRAPIADHSTSTGSTSRAVPRCTKRPNTNLRGAEMRFATMVAMRAAGFPSGRP